MSGRAKLRRRQFHIAVFAGARARDLVGIFTAIAYTKGEALQQVWDYIRDNWISNPATFEYHAIAVPALSEKGQVRSHRQPITPERGV